MILLEHLGNRIWRYGAGDQKVEWMDGVDTPKGAFQKLPSGFFPLRG